MKALLAALLLLPAALRAQSFNVPPTPSSTTYSNGLPQRVILTSATIVLPVNIVSTAAFTVNQGTAPFVIRFASTQPISAASLPLPNGAATEGTQVAVSTTLAAIKARADLLATEATVTQFQAIFSTNSAGLRVDASGSTSPVSVASLPLPQGAATEATLAAVSTTAAAIKLRADLLATEQTLSAFKALLSTNSVGLQVDASRSTSPVSIASLPLPLGAATEATLTALSTTTTALKARADLLATQATLQTFSNFFSSSAAGVRVDASGSTSPVSVAVLPLPFGAATEATLATISTTAASIKARADLLATESTLAGISTTTTALKQRADLLATEATEAAISTTAAAIKARADLLATEATAAAISSNAAAGFRQNQLIGNTTFQIINSSVAVPGVATESTLAAISTTAAAIKLRADLLSTEATLAAFKALVSTNAVGILVDASKSTSPVSVASLPLPLGAATEATAAAISTTAAAIKARADLLGTEATLAAVSSNVAAGFRQGQLIGNTSFLVYQSSPAWQAKILDVVTVAIASAPPLAFYQSGGAVATTSTSTIVSGQSGGALATTSTSTIISGQTGGALATTSTSTVISTGSITIFLPANLPTLPTISTTSIPTGTNNIGTMSGSSVAVFNVAGTSISVHQADANFSVNNSSVTDIPIEKTQAERGGYFAATTNIVSMAVAETPLFLFVNVATNTVSAYVDVVDFINSNIGTGVGASNSVFRVYRAPVVTSSGTALGEFNGDSGSANVSKMQSFLSPTLSSNGTLVFTFSSEGTTISRPLNQSRIIRPGAKIVITVSNTIAATPAAVNFAWSEE